MEILINKEKGVVLLSVDKNTFEINSEIKNYAENNDYKLKKDSHITLIGYKEAREILASGVNLSEIEKIVKSVKWNFTCKAEFYELKKKFLLKDDKNEEYEETRQTIIQAVDLPESKNFYQQIKNLTGVIISGFPHITLYAKNDSKSESPEGIGISSKEELYKNCLKRIFLENEIEKIERIIIPTRLQVDTLIAIFLLKKFGGEKFLEVEKAILEIKPDPQDEKGAILLDVKNSVFDHHYLQEKTTASKLVCEYFGIVNNPSIQKLLTIAERDDFFGKGIISTDQIDKTFGLPGLLTAANKSGWEVNEISKVFLKVLEAHYLEEQKRNEKLPQIFGELLKSGKAKEFKLKQNKKNLRVAILEEDDYSISGYLRSINGGRYDVVVQWNSAGYLNITTRPTKRVDLSGLASILRKSELLIKGQKLDLPESDFKKDGTLSLVPEWYYDRATNSLLNGGINPNGIAPTIIPKNKIENLVVLGLSR